MQAECFTVLKLYTLLRYSHKNYLAICYDYSVIKIIPAILTSSPQELKDMIMVCEEIVDRVQIDVIDGIFANNKTVDPQAVSYIETNLMLDMHLMVKEPINWLERCMRAHADRVIGHIEMMSSQKDFILKSQELGMKAGFALDITTPVSSLDASLLSDVDVVLVMSVPAGHGGQSFQVKALDKIKELDVLRQDAHLSFSICDDGGITLEWIDDARREGADEVAVGRKLFDGGLGENIKTYLEASYK